MTAKRKPLIAVLDEKPVQGLADLLAQLGAWIKMGFCVAVAIFVGKFIWNTVTGGTVEQITVAVVRHFFKSLWQILSS